MSTAENAILYYEAGQDFTDFTNLFDAGDHLEFASLVSLWSQRAGSKPVVRPNGVRTGGTITAAAAATDDTIDISALTAYLGGSSVSVGAQTSVDCDRGTAANPYRINSIQITDAGTVVVAEGTVGSAFSETRAAAGGPPLIPVTSIEIGQVRFSDDAPAAVVAADIKQIPGTHKELSNYPAWKVNYSNVSNNQLGAAGVEFLSALPLSHAGPSTKSVFASYSEPEFAALSKAEGFVPAEKSHTISSTQIYGDTIGASSESLGAGAFVAYLEDGITDHLMTLKNAFLWFKFKQDRLQDAYILTQGKLGVTRTFPAGDNIAANCTITPESQSEEVSQEATLVASTTTTTTSTTTSATTTTDHP